MKPCQFCGTPYRTNGMTIARGKWFCSTDHADRFIASKARKGTFGQVAAVPARPLTVTPIEPPPAESTNVMRASMFDGLIDSHQTEAELNGHRASQGRMF